MNDSVLELRAYLMDKSEQELKAKLYRGSGNSARLNGPKSKLVERVIEMCSNSMSSVKFKELFPSLHRRRFNPSLSSDLPPQAVERRSATSASIDRFRPSIRSLRTPLSSDLPPQAVERRSATAASIDRFRPSIRSLRTPLSSRRPSPPLFNDWEEGLIQELSFMLSPRLQRSNTNLEVSSFSPSRRPRVPSTSGGDNVGPEVQMSVSPVAALVCKICLDKKINTVLLPCGHACCCQECSRQIQYATWDKTCPICRAKIQNVSLIYFS